MEKIDKFSKESQGSHRRHDQHRRSSNIAKILPNSNVPDCNACWGHGNNLLQLWKKYEVYAKSNRVRPEQV